MRVLIDATCISDETFGTSQYAFFLLRALAGLDDEVRYSVLIKQRLAEDNPVFTLERAGRIRLIRTPLRIGGPQQQFKFFLHRNRVDADVFHCLTYNLPLLFNRYKSICTVHDLKFILYPEYMHSLRRLKKIYFYWVTRLACQKCSAIIAISKATKSDLIHHIGVPEQKIAVISEASTLDRLQETFHGIMDTVLKQYGITGRYFLVLGCRRPHKNITNALKGFARFLERHDNENWQIVITGSQRSYAGGILYPGEHRHQLREKVIATGYVSSEELDLLYRGAHALLYPSLYEGFGLPILEAMEREVPVITSDRSSMPEVAGDAGILIDPLDYRSIAKGMEMLTDERQRQHVIARGRTRVKKFSWQRTAEQTLQVYKRVVDDAP